MKGQEQTGRSSGKKPVRQKGYHETDRVAVLRHQEARDGTDVSEYVRQAVVLIPRLKGRMRTPSANWRAKGAPGECRRVRSFGGTGENWKS